MDNILANYQVVFSTPMNYAFHNRADTINEVISMVLEDHYTVYDANALLNGINQVISDPGTDDVYFYTQRLNLALVTKTTTFFYEDSDAYDANNTIPPDYSLPTSDFQVIAQAWQNYLTNSPNTPSSPAS